MPHFRNSSNTNLEVKECITLHELLTPLLVTFAALQLGVSHEALPGPGHEIGRVK